jgi:LCP family protein required for cell wall assembly
MGIEPHPGIVWNTSPAAFTGSSDMMLLLRLDPDRQLMRVLSIPKDSQVVMPQIGLGKISLANSLGPALAAQTVSRTLNNVPIDRYVRITTDALQQLVEQLGGVEIFVPQQMQYQDATGQLQIDLDRGWQTLNGEQAEQFARFRASNVGDLDRVQRQQMLLKAIRDRLTSPAVLPRLPQIARIMQSYINTNLSPEEILAIGNFAVALNWENIQMMLLPGDLSPFSQDPSSYWIYTPGQDQMMKYFGVDVIGVAKPKALTSLKIAVQNASGKPNLSQQVANYLKRRGFEKVYVVSDWSDSQRQTEIIAQKGNLEAAAEMQKVLGLGNVEASAIGDLKSYLTIRVGKDWNSDLQP